MVDPPRLYRNPKDEVVQERSPTCSTRDTKVGIQAANPLGEKAQRLPQQATPSTDQIKARYSSQTNSLWTNTAEHRSGFKLNSRDKFVTATRMH